MCLTDISPGALWRGTFLQQVPWETPPNYVQLFGFDLLMVVPDLLHCVNLGIARDLAGSVLKSILRDQQIFQGENIDLRLQRATESLKAYARQHGHILRMKKLTKKSLLGRPKSIPSWKPLDLTPTWFVPGWNSCWNLVRIAMQIFVACYGHWTAAWDCCMRLIGSWRPMRKKLWKP